MSFGAPRRPNCHDSRSRTRNEGDGRAGCARHRRSAAAIRRPVPTTRSATCSTMSAGSPSRLRPRPRRRRLHSLVRGPRATRRASATDWRTRIPRDLAELANAWRDPNAWTGMTQAGGIDLPGEIAGLVALDEVVIHGWDVARATGQPFDPNPAVLEAVHGFVAQFSGPGQEESRARPVRARGARRCRPPAARPRHRHGRTRSRLGAGQPVALRPASHEAASGGSISATRAS